VGQVCANCRVRAAAINASALDATARTRGMVVATVDLMKNNKATRPANPKNHGTRKRSDAGARRDSELGAAYLRQATGGYDEDASARAQFNQIDMDTILLSM
jgi:hypothetical protein